MYKSFLLLLIAYFCNFACSNSVPEKRQKGTEIVHSQPKEIIVGAERLEQYLPMLKGKNIAMVVNQTSKIKGKHIVDSLLSLGIIIEKILDFIKS